MEIDGRNLIVVDICDVRTGTRCIPDFADSSDITTVNRVEILLDDNLRQSGSIILDANPKSSAGSENIGIRGKCGSP